MSDISPPTIPVPTCCTPQTSGTKFHFSLNVANLERSLTFYRILFGTPPAKSYPDYAKFELDRPPLVFSLVPNPPGAGGGLTHLGLPVRSRDEVDTFGTRLEQAGLTVSRQQDTVCGYARQDKIWVADPDGNHWEIYVVHADIPPEAARPESRIEPASQSPPQDAARPVIWEHRVLDPLPEPIPHDDATVDEVRLQGAFNSEFDELQRRRLLAEVFRILKPGGVLDVHGLVADRPPANGLPALPGVAALVRRVPVESEPLQELAAAGFTSIAITKLPARAVFSSGQVEMREIKLSARRPGLVLQTSDGPPRRVVYRGPFESAVADSGAIFLRGVRTEVSEQEWNELSSGPAQDQFVFLSGEASCVAACER